MGIGGFEVGIGDYGRPYLVDRPTFDFNISHSGDWVLCVIGAERKVGVDVEQTGEFLEEVVDRFSQSEVSYIRERSGGDRVEAFYRIWTAKEAYLKADGRTFLISLDGFTVDVAGGRARLSSGGEHSPIPWNLALGTLDADHPYAVCYSGGPVECSPHQIMRQELTLEG